MLLKNFSDPKQNIERLQIMPSNVVVDLGSGVGHYALLASRYVGNSGKVYGVDVQKGLVEKLKQEAEERGVTNVEAIWGDVESVGGSNLRNDIADCLIATNILYTTESKSGFVHECNRILKPGGKLLLIDWSESFGGIGPKPEHVVTKRTAQELFENGGFITKSEFDAGEHHYGFVFEKMKN